MSSNRSWKCYFRCEVEGVLHRFPNPHHNAERFNLWTIVLDSELQKRDPMYIYNTLRLCDKHFELCYRTPNGKLTRNAFPTLNTAAYQLGSQPLLMNESVMAESSNIGLTSMSVTQEIIQPLKQISDSNLLINLISGQYPSTSQALDANVTLHVQDNVEIPSKSKYILQSAEVIEPAPTVMSNIICDNCRKTILGFRYKCLNCVDFNLCKDCEMQETHPNHYMIRMPKSPECKIPEKVIEKMCVEFKPAHIISCAEESHWRRNISINNNLKACDSDEDLSEEVKLLICKEVTRVVKNKSVNNTSDVKIDVDKIKRKRKLPDGARKKRKINVQTTTINDKEPAIVETGQSDNVHDLESVNTNESYDAHDGSENNESTPAIATVVHDATCPGAVHMVLSPEVSQLIIEMIQDGEQVVYKYVDS